MKIVIFIVLLSCFACSNSQETSYSNDTFAGKLNGRNYIVELPKNYSSSKSYKLLLAFHGAGGNGLEMKNTASFTNYSENYIFVYPDAATENWEEGCKCNKPHRLGIDDIGFISTLIDTLHSFYKIETGKVYAAGFSQGGLFTHNVACKLDSKIKAAAVVASPMSVPLAQDCKDQHKMNILMIHGKSDAVLQYNGFTDTKPSDGDFSLHSSPETLNHWARKNGYTGNAIRSFHPSSRNYVLDSYKENGKATVQLFSINFGGHSWRPNSFNSSQEIIKFFDQF